MRPRLMFSVFLLATTLAATVPAPFATAAPGLSPKSSSMGGVTVEVTPRIAAGPEWQFEVAFNTHSQELKDDLEKSALLIADGRESRPTAWKSDPPGGHHRKGVLSFAAPAPPPSAVELRIQRPGEPSPRSFQWQLK